VGFAALAVELVGIGRDVAEQVRGMGCEPRVLRRGGHRALAEAPRLVEPTKPKGCVAQGVVGPAAVADDPSLRDLVDERPTLLEPLDRFAPLTELRQGPGGRGDGPGKLEDDVPGAKHGDPALAHGARFRPVALHEVEVPAAK
jgi:hypothetical protein